LLRALQPVRVHLLVQSCLSSAPFLCLERDLINHISKHQLFHSNHFAFDLLQTVIFKPYTLFAMVGRAFLRRKIHSMVLETPFLDNLSNPEELDAANFESLEESLAELAEIETWLATLKPLPWSSFTYLGLASPSLDPSERQNAAFFSCQNSIEMRKRDVLAISDISTSAMLLDHCEEVKELLDVAMGKLLDGLKNEWKSRLLLDKQLHVSARKMRVITVGLYYFKFLTLFF